MKKLVILSGSGISAESGIQTFRGMGGLWEKYDVTELASPQAWAKNPELVLRFYNERRKKVIEANPNTGHTGLAKLENHFNVQVITQNVDDLHERAGNKNILHLHGEIRKSRSTKDPSKIFDIEGWELKLGDKCPLGSQLRPHIIWFGEPVSKIEIATNLAAQADIFVVVGTSLQVYPAAGLVQYAPQNIPKYLIDPDEMSVPYGFKHIKENATTGVEKLLDLLIN